ncbi:DegT/DnrJ/EryC1/StrS family aminotransferase [Rheinheimera maricola]|uniref:DegT/DnrJ/EryC1/StrS family aminotransferase n=1 Tax=Rheinheimera maricola TaxID=2793282 RepID=A0ABS7X428_9GAMM|nr:DegT/DnrJ/EryC1/StrS family aminotransferase [Rheinheimera maricola]MBZ9610309.1 DegT/DnrJ/EryC1/StrS family aminotransferase [Rheinheimera maricola]
MIAFDTPILVTRPIFPDINGYKKQLDAIWESQWLSNNGPKHKALEAQLQRFINAPNLSLFNNGTVALQTAIQSLRLQGEVITTPFSFPATTHVLTWNGIQPVFCDIHPQTLTLDPAKIESLITAKTSAILGVHVYGIPCHVQEIEEVASRHGLRVVYDAAHAFTTKVNGLEIAQYGDISMFSFHPTKLFHTGEGGALVYNDSNLKERIDYLKNFGIKNENEVILPGINGKMSELQAAMGLEVLPLVEQEKYKRSKIREVYTRFLSQVPGITVLAVEDNASQSEQYFCIRIDAKAFGLSRNDVYEKLKTFNVFSRKYFYPLISNYPCYSNIASANPAYLPVASQAEHEVLCLPFYGALPLEYVERICKIILSFR